MEMEKTCFDVTKESDVNRIKRKMEIEKTSFEGKEDFDISLIKRKDILKTFSDDKYLALNNSFIISTKTLKVKRITSIIIDVNKIAREGKKIANKNHWNKTLKRCRS